MKNASSITTLLILTLLCLSSQTFMKETGMIDLDNLLNYANQAIPNYINKDNTPPNNPITDIGATLGRVLFYDQNLSVDNSTACASCHQQTFAFSDPAQLSLGRSGDFTGRHSMRLINARFSDEERFFWDERAASVEEQSTEPIQDHIEMGFSGDDGDPDLDSLIRKMATLPYYPTLFNEVYGSPEITEERMQLALAQFIRSIQSFDSKYDEGRVQVNNNNTDFPNFTEQENRGKQLFHTPPRQGGAGCNACHRAPEFDIDPNSRNNGVIGVAGDPTDRDLTNTRSPSLRDMINPDDELNGPLMHDGSLPNLMAVINHYDDVPGPGANNPTLDPRLAGDGQGQNLNLSQADKESLVAFLSTLTGSNVYTDEKWSNPFDEDGNLTITSASINFVKAKIFLEGAYDTNTQNMRTDLFDNNILNTIAPYDTAPWNHVENISITGAVTAIVDWVLIEVMDENFNTITTRAALLDANGAIRDVDGTDEVKLFGLNNTDSYYFAIRHRNHLDLISNTMLTTNNTNAYDFSMPNMVMGGVQQLRPLNNGRHAMRAGDFNGDGVISVADFNTYVPQIGTMDQYLVGDVNLDGRITVMDFNFYTPNAAAIGVNVVRY